MDLEPVVARITGDASNFNRMVEEVIRNLGKLEGRLSATMESVRQFNDSQRQMAQAERDLAQTRKTLGYEAVTAKMAELGEKAWSAGQKQIQANKLAAQGEADYVKALRSAQTETDGLHAKRVQNTLARDRAMAQLNERRIRDEERARLAATRANERDIADKEKIDRLQRKVGGYILDEPTRQARAKRLAMDPNQFLEMTPAQRAMGGPNPFEPYHLTPRERRIRWLQTQAYSEASVPTVPLARGPRELDEKFMNYLNQAFPPSQGGGGLFGGGGGGIGGGGPPLGGGGLFGRGGWRTGFIGAMAFGGLSRLLGLGGRGAGGGALMGGYLGGPGGAIAGGTLGLAFDATNVGIGLMEKGLRAAVGAVEELITHSVKLGMEWENNVATFTVLTGSAESGKRLMADLQKLAIETPYTTRQYAGMAQTLLGGGFGGGQVVPALSRLGDIAGGDPGRLAHLVDIYTQLSAQGHMSGDIARRFRRLGLGPQDFSKALGMSLTEFTAKSQAGMIGSGEIGRAIGTLTSPGGRFYGMQAERMKTVSGALSNMEETVDRILGRFGIGLFEKLNIAGWINKGTEALANMEKYIGPILDKIEQLYHDLEGPAKDAWNAVKQGAMDLLGVLGIGTWDDFRMKIIGWAKELPGIITGVVVPALKTMWEILKKIAEAAYYFSQVISSTVALADKQEALQRHEAGEGRVLSYEAKYRTGELTGETPLTKDVMTDLAQRHPSGLAKAMSYLPGMKSYDEMDKAHQERRADLLAQSIAYYRTHPEEKIPGYVREQNPTLTARLEQEQAEELARRSGIRTGGNLSQKTRAGLAASQAFFGGTPTGSYFPGPRAVGLMPTLPTLEDPYAQKLAEHIIEQSAQKGISPLGTFAMNIGRIDMAQRGILRGPPTMAGRFLVPSFEPQISAQQAGFAQFEEYRSLRQSIQPFIEQLPPTAMAGTTEAQDIIARSQAEQMTIQEEIAQTLAAANVVHQGTKAAIEQIQAHAAEIRAFVKTIRPGGI